MTFEKNKRSVGLEIPWVPDSLYIKLERLKPRVSKRKNILFEEKTAVFVQRCGANAANELTQVKRRVSLTAVE